MMKRSTGPRILSAILFLALAMLACSIPGARPVSAPVPPLPKEAQATLEALPKEAQATAEALAQQLPAVLTAIPTLAAEGIQTSLPTVTLEGGTGYIFSTNQISKTDRDIWWNALQIVPDQFVRMASLGVISSPTDIHSFVVSGPYPNVLVPAIGEGFALEIDRDGVKTYAVMRVVGIDKDFNLTFDWVYPFLGNAVFNP